MLHWILRASFVLLFVAGSSLVRTPAFATSFTPDAFALSPGADLQNPVGSMAAAQSPTGPWECDNGITRVRLTLAGETGAVAVEATVVMAVDLADAGAVPVQLRSLAGDAAVGIPGVGTLESPAGADGELLVLRYTGTIDRSALESFGAVGSQVSLVLGLDVGDEAVESCATAVVIPGIPVPNVAAPPVPGQAGTFPIPGNGQVGGALPPPPSSVAAVPAGAPANPGVAAVPAPSQPPAASSPGRAAPSSSQATRMGCGAESSLRSTESNVMTSITFANHTNTALAIFVLDMQGQWQYRTTVQAGQSSMQATPVSYVWGVATLQGRECLGVFLPGSSPDTVVLSGSFVAGSSSSTQSQQGGGYYSPSAPYPYTPYAPQATSPGGGGSWCTASPIPQNATAPIPSLGGVWSSPYAYPGYNYPSYGYGSGSGGSGAYYPYAYGYAYGYSPLGNCPTTR
jgi:hypothetical protein